MSCPLLLCPTLFILFFMSVPHLSARRLALIVVAITLNLGIGFLVQTFKLPFYLDSIGTLLATALGGWYVGVVSGIGSTLIGSLYIPTLWAYSGTAVVIATFTWLAMRYGFLKKWGATILGGLLLGVAAAIVSAPVTTFVYGGVSLSGTDVVTAFFSTLGHTLLRSVFLGGISVDPIDKLFTALIAFALLRRIPMPWRTLSDHEQSPRLQ